MCNWVVAYTTESSFETSIFINVSIQLVEA